jgi:hypothetical protein
MLNTAAQPGLGALSDLGSVRQNRPAAAGAQELGAAEAQDTDVAAGARLAPLNCGARRLGEFEQFTFSGWHEETVHGYVLKPYGYTPGQRYPIAFLVHGGPQASMQNIWTYRWNAQAFAGAGYAVVMIDFHGSPGYGQAFTDSISRDWGGKPLVDLQKGLAAAIALTDDDLPDLEHDMRQSGALGVELKKVGYYCLGAGHALPAAQDIPAAIRLLALTVAMVVGLLAIVQVLLSLL